MHLNKTLTIILVAAISLGACGSPHERANSYVEKAQEFFDKGDYAHSRVEAMNAVQIEGRNAQARYLLAKIAENNRNLLQAVYHLQIAVENDPEHIPARLNLGNLYFLAKFPDKAAEQSAVLMELAPENAEVRTLSARIYFQNGDMAGARKEIDYALGLNPRLIEAIIFKAGLLMNEESYDSAIRFVDENIPKIDFDKVLPLRQFRIMLLRGADRNDEVEEELKSLIRDFPDREYFAISLARLYASQDMIDKTEEIIQSLIDKFPNDMNRRISYVQFIAENRGLQRAIGTLKDIIREFPDKLILQLLLGRLYEATDSTEKALATYREIARKAPTSKQGLVSRNRIAVYLISSGQVDKAMQMIDSILSDEVNNYEALLVKATYNFSGGKFDSAIGELRTVLRTDEKSEHALLLLARAHMRAGNMELAEDAYRRLLKVNPRHPTATTELADLVAKRGNTRYAADILRQRLEFDPQNREVASALIMALIGLDDLVTAEAVARKIIKTNDTSGLAEFQLGQVMQAKGDDQKAIKAYLQALEKDPVAQPPLLGITEVYVDDERYDQAITFLQDRLAKYPEQMFLKFLIGTVYAKRGDTEKAKLQFENVLAEHPDSIRTYLAMVELYPDLHEERIKIYRRGLNANPDNRTLNLMLALEYQQAGKYGNAIELYEKIMEKDPGNDLVANNLAVLLLDQRSDAASHARALQLAKRFAKNPNAAVNDTLGWAYYRNGDLKNAIRYLKLAIESSKETPSLHYHLGMAYYSAREMESARQELQQAIMLAKSSYPGIDVARETLDSILNQTVTL